jgi:plasmid maintenance system antidote protein VapI
MRSDRKPAEAWPVRDFLFEEMAARGWTEWDVARQMGGDAPMNVLILEFIFYLPYEESLFLGRDTAEDLDRAFNISPEFFLNLEETWRRFNGWKSRSEMETAALERKARQQAEV